MNELTILQQGDSLDFSFDRGGRSIDGWTCTITVRTKPSATAAFTRVIAPLDGRWSGYITQTESTALALGLYYLVALLANTTTDEQETEKVRFRIVTAWT